MDDLSKSIVQMSHLSDVQEMINMDPVPREEIHQKLNFVKALSHSGQERFTEKELNDIWEDIQKRS